MYSVWVNTRDGKLEKLPSEYDTSERAARFARTLISEEKSIVSTKVVDDGFNAVVLTFRRKRKEPERKPITRRIDAVKAMNRFILDLNDTAILLNWSDDGIADYFDLARYTYGNEWHKVKKLFFQLVEDYAVEHPNAHILAELPDGLRECK